MFRPRGHTRWRNFVSTVCSMPSPVSTAMELDATRRAMDLNKHKQSALRSRANHG